MTAVQSAYILAAIQLLLIILLAADRWVHRVTGKAPLEARVAALESGQADLKETISDGQTNLSEMMGRMQKLLGEVQMTLVRQDEHFKSTDKAVDACTAQLNQLRGGDGPRRW